MRQLDDSALHGLPTEVRRPEYDRRELRPRWVHVGVGAFHRCHQAEYLDDLAHLEPEWGITGVNVAAPDVLSTMRRQNLLFTRVLRSGSSGDDVRIIGSMIDAIPHGSTAACIERIASEQTDVVSCTITEKGYCHIPATGEPDPENPDLAHDLAMTEDLPISVPAILAAAMDERRRIGGGPISLMSCDNVPGNGRVLERMVRHVASAQSPDLVSWIDDNVGFVETMVDRIVPATPVDEVDRLAERIGVRDEVPVVGEPFRQWVISDTFRGPRPFLEAVDATVTSDVEPYEVLKMRVVNGGQSMLCYLAALAGIETIADAVAQPALRELVERQLEVEVQPFVPKVALDVDAYRRTLIERLVNPALGHTSHQIATDGSRKIVPRFIRPLAAAHAAGRETPILALGIAAWIRYQSAVDDDGREFGVSDPANQTIRSLVRDAGTDSYDIARAVLEHVPIFGDIAADDRAVAEVSHALHELGSFGALGAVGRLLEHGPAAVGEGTTP